MSDPFRLRVQKAISASLAAMRVADGYSFDFDDKVFRGRLMYGDTDPVPMLSIIEPPLPNEKATGPVASTADKSKWELIIQGFVKDDYVNPTDPAHLAMADTKRKLALEIKRRGPGSARNQPDPFGINFEEDGKSKPNRIMNMTIGAGVVRPPEEVVSSKAYFWLTLTLEIVEDNLNPFG